MPISRRIVFSLPFNICFSILHFSLLFSSICLSVLSKTKGPSALGRSVGERRDSVHPPANSTCLYLKAC